jgi:hypothetical protein
MTLIFYLLKLKILSRSPPIPLIVLTAPGQPGTKPRQKMLWQKWQREITKLSPNGVQIIAWGSSHYIQKQQPQLVVDPIYTIIKSDHLESNFTQEYSENSMDLVTTPCCIHLIDVSNTNAMPIMAR